MTARLILAALLAATAAPLAAQTGVSAGVEVASDDARRGLSWSAGRVSPAADVSGELAGFALSAGIAATRDSPRHGGADAAITLQAAKRWLTGAVEIEARGTGYLFAGARGGLDYGEVGGSVRYTIGPLQVSANADYAPDQDAIGGDNLYLRAGAAAGIPATPVSLRASIGRSIGGNATGPAADPRAGRLRPAGDYTDWRVGGDYVAGPFTFGLDYVGTNVARRAATSPFADARHAGDRIVARARIGF